MDDRILREATIRIQIEYIGLPGLKLSAAQVSRVFGIQRELCEAALATLTETGFLRKTPHGVYRRRDVVSEADLHRNGHVGPFAA